MNKVNVAFAGLYHGGVSKPFAKIDAMAKARQHRLSERQTANLLLEFIKKREQDHSPEAASHVTSYDESRLKP